MVNKNLKNKKNIVSDNLTNKIDSHIKKSSNRFDFKKIKVAILWIILFLFNMIFTFSFVRTKIASSTTVTQDSVLNQLKKNINLPETQPIDFKRISDAKALSSQALFYKDVKNGDYIIVYDYMALVYDFTNSKIISIKTKN